MEALAEFLVKLGLRPETGLLGALCLGLLAIAIKLLLMLDKSRTRNLELSDEMKDIQEKRIAEGKEITKTLERVSSSLQALVSSAQTQQAFMQTFMQTFMRGRE